MSTTKYFLYICLIFNIIPLQSTSDKRCSHIDAETSKILNTRISGTFYLADDSSADYLQASKQWSYPSYKASRIHPSIIIYPKGDNDIFVILAFARLCDYKVVIRSGGHQYDALSSCNSAIHACIQIDMKHYNAMQIHAANHTLQIEPGVKLGEMNTYLDAHNYFLPGGEHPGIGIGGHILTGGDGFLSKSHGLLADYVHAFDIILSNGTKIQHVTHSDPVSKDLYWAVLGGGPGAYGIVTKYELDLSATNNAAYKDSVGFVYRFQYSRPAMLVFAELFRQLHEDKVHYLENDNVASLMLCLLYDFELADYVIKIAWIWTGKHPEKRDAGYLSDLFLNAAEKQLSLKPLKEQRMQASISKLLLAMSEDYGDIAPMPYMLRSYNMKRNIDEEFIDLLVDRIELVYTKYGGYQQSGMAVFLLLESFAKGAVYRNDARMSKTSFPYREQFIQFPILMFYNTAIYENAGQMTEKWLDDTMEVLMITKPYEYGEDDYRALSLTFGDVDIEHVWSSYYHNETAFERLKEIKLKYDELDMFHTSFTTPLPVPHTNEHKHDL